MLAIVRLGPTSPRYLSRLGVLWTIRRAIRHYARCGTNALEKVEWSYSNPDALFTQGALLKYAGQLISQRGHVPAQMGDPSPQHGALCAPAHD